MTIKADLAKTEPRHCGIPHIGGCPLLSIGACLVLGTLYVLKTKVSGFKTTAPPFFKDK